MFLLAGRAEVLAVVAAGVFPNLAASRKSKKKIEADRRNTERKYHE